MHKYTNTEVKVMNHVVFCTLSIAMSVPEENFKILLNKCCPKPGLSREKRTHCF